MGTRQGREPVEKELVKDNFAEKVVKDPLFKKQKRLSELFDLENYTTSTQR